MMMFKSQQLIGVILNGLELKKFQNLMTKMVLWLFSLMESILMIFNKELLEIVTS